MEPIKIPLLKDEEDAKKKAKECLIKLFENKMLTIDTIKVMINEFHKHENQNSIEVFNKIERNINELDSSLKAIDQMILNMTEANIKHGDFYTSWKKITTPINDYGSDLEKLMLSKKNVSLMTHNLDMYVKVQDQVKEMRSLMENDSNVAIVFKQIRYLAYSRVALLERVKTEARSDKLNNLADHLMCVNKFEEEFFEKFWSYFRNPIQRATEKPEFLVKLLRLIEEDPDYLNNIRSIFKVYHRPEDKFQGIESNNPNNNPNANTNKGQSIRESNVRETIALYEEDSENLSEILQSKIPEFIEMNIQERFKDKQTREEILEETLNVVSELYLIQTKVVPCFPPKYNILEVYKNQYLAHIKEKIKPFLDQEELEKTPGLLIPIAHWFDQFDERLKKVGIDINQTDLASEVTYYMHLFFDHINEVLDSNINTVIMKNREDKTKLKEAKKLELDKIQSYYATDIYTSIFNVIELLSGDFKGQLLFQIIKTIMEKLTLLIKASEDELRAFNLSGELVMACVYVYDASKCLEIFPSFKKKIKELLPKDYYDHIKLRYINSTPSVLTMYNANIRLGCGKAIQLMYKELEKNYLNKLFTKEWTDDIFIGIFSTFREYFNRGFTKLLKTQNNLLIIVRCFIECFVKYYVEEIMHSVRSLNRKTIKGQNSCISNYRLQYLTIDPNEIVYKEKKKDKEKSKDKNKEKDEGEQQQALEGKEIISSQVKVLDMSNGKKQSTFKKYIFPVKKFKTEDKTYDPLKILDRISQDKVLFETFLCGFADDAKEPFSKNFSQTLGVNYINSFINKFGVIISIMKSHSSALKDQIIQFKEYYNDEEGKALLESLLYIREDTPAVTKADMKLFLLNTFDCR